MKLPGSAHLSQRTAPRQRPLGVTFSDSSFRTRTILTALFPGPTFMPFDELRHVDDVAANHLPFAISDYEKANAVFVRWRASGDPTDKRIVDIWSYCYIQRYFLTQFRRERGTPSEKARCVSRAIGRLENALPSIQDPDKFASYVSVLCKNLLRNHRRDRRDTSEVDDRIACADPISKPSDHDSALIRYVFAQVLKEVSPSLRAVGTLRFLNYMEYAEIAEETGIALPTVHTYAHRVMVRMRGDDRVRALHFDDLLPPDLAAPDSTS